MSQRLIAAALALFLLFVAGPVLAAEQITQFTDAVTLNKDASVDVTETIDVNAEGIEIRHGIYRDIPTILINPDGSELHSALKVIAVTRDDRSEPYSIEHIGNGFVRIRIGDADTIVPTGQHRYVIHYTMSRMGRIFPDHDELYWNATGNYWVFPILKASAAVTLPDGATISETRAFTGPVGSAEAAATTDKTAPNVAVFRTTRTLAPGEGMTVALAFQKGVLTAPGPGQQAQYWISDHRDVLLPIAVLLAVLGYNIWAWAKVGRDPRKGTIIPLFYPPNDMSPALVNYVHNFGWKKSGWTAVTSALFDLGVKGLVTIDTSGKDLKVTAVAQPPQARLAPEESVLGDWVRSKGVLEVNKASGPELVKKRQEALNAVKTTAGKNYFVQNYAYVAGSVIVGLVALGLMAMFDVLDAGWLVGGGIAIVVLLAIVLSAGGFTIGRGFGSVIVLVWGAILVINGLGAIGAAVTTVQFGFPSLAAVSIILVTIIFGAVMRAATPDGRKVMDQIDGFRMYMETAEKNRLNFVDEPRMSVNRFEAILPFAIALGVEKPWSHRFEADLARNAVDGVQDGVYIPLWYAGSRDGGFGTDRVASTVSSMAAAMSASMIAAQPAQSSSSGFSGGGSGGGGGGGGGGGW